MKRQPRKKPMPSLPRDGTQSAGAKVPSILLTAPIIKATWLNDPNLVFGGSGLSDDPKIGIPLFGPMSYNTSRHREEIHAGIIATSQLAETAIKFYEHLSSGVDGTDIYCPFPGCKPSIGYRTKIVFNNGQTEIITHAEHQEILSIKKARDRFDKTILLFEQKIRLLSEKDHPIDHIVIAIPDDIYKKCRVADYTDEHSTAIHRDLRRSIKAIAMKYKVATQILQESTFDLEFTPREKEHLSVIAWNLFTGLYFKSDGLPWGPSNISPGTCFIGVSFFRPVNNAGSIRTSVAQAFDENGEGLVLRGKSFQWDENKQGRSPHLSEELASDLISQMIKRYREERKQSPKKIVIHKTSRFEQNERNGFVSVLKEYNCQYDLVALENTSMFRLVRAGRYPPLRGACFSIGDLNYLYTTGFLPTSNQYPHGHVPSPLQIADHVGDSSKSELFRDIMVLTKMNWNSANVDGAFPITLQFARAVGDVMREVPEGQEPHPKYKFYI